jgi:hypothetical protein
MDGFGSSIAVGRATLATSGAFEKSFDNVHDSLAGKNHDKEKGCPNAMLEQTAVKKLFTKGVLHELDLNDGK